MHRIYFYGRWVPMKDEPYKRLEYARKQREKECGESFSHEDVLIEIMAMRLPPAQAKKLKAKHAATKQS